MKNIATFALSLSLVALLAACSKPAALPEPMRAVKVFSVGDSGLTAAYEFSGEVRARVETRVGFRVGGKVTKRFVEVGQRVSAGQLLATLDAQDLQLAAAAGKAQVQAAQVQVDLAAADFKRFKDLKDQNFISGAELDRREATLKAANATLDQAKAQLATQGNQTGYASLFAPVSGVVVAVDVEAGVVVAAGTPVLRIAEAAGRDAVFAVPEDKIAAIKVGQAVDLRLSSDAQALKGKVREIAAVADPATRTYGVKVGIDGGSPPLGATVYVKPQALSAQALGVSAQKLPTAALFEVAGKSNVWVFDARTSVLSARGVQVITADANEVVIAPGALKTGEQVVAAGVHVLQAGQKVTLWRNPDAQAAAKTANLEEKSQDVSRSIESTATKSEVDSAPSATVKK